MGYEPRVFWVCGGAQFNFQRRQPSSTHLPQPFQPPILPATHCPSHPSRPPSPAAQPPNHSSCPFSHQGLLLFFYYSLLTPGLLVYMYRWVYWFICIGGFTGLPFFWACSSYGFIQDSPYIFPVGVFSYYFLLPSPSYLLLWNIFLFLLTTLGFSFFTYYLRPFSFYYSGLFLFYLLLTAFFLLLLWAFPFFTYGSSKSFPCYYLRPFPCYYFRPTSILLPVYFQYTTDVLPMYYR